MLGIFSRGAAPSIGSPSAGSASAGSPQASPPREGDEVAHPSIRLWLALCAVLVLLTLSIGGMTRLTNSGLSITEWEPIIGILPPLTVEDWRQAFEKYKTTYEFRHVNMAMTLDDFRTIFNWEWRHRLVARLVFLAVFIPFVGYLLAGRLPKSMHKKILLVLGLIVLQGFIGWLMVQSGLRSDVKVSPYRLALHLGLASLLFAMLVALALAQDARPRPPARDMAVSQRWGRILIGLIFTMILFGALVAGLRGGRSHDTWPLMEGSLIPNNLFQMSPWPANFFENPLTAQWMHRLIAYILLAVAAVHWRRVIGRDEPETVERGAFWLLIGVVAQALLGIVTVVNQVPVPLGLAHQLLAFGLLAASIWHLFEIERHAPRVVDGDVSVRTETGTGYTTGRAAGQAAGLPRPIVRPTPQPASPQPASPQPVSPQPVSPTPGVTQVSAAGSGRPGGLSAIDLSSIGTDRPSGAASPTPYRRPKLDS